MTTLSEETVQSTRHAVHVELMDGKELEASVGEARPSRALDDVLQQLEASTFVRIGENTTVRTADVRCVRISDHDDDGSGQGLVDSLKQRIGGSDMSYDPRRGGTAVQQQSDGGQAQPGIADQFFAYGRGRPWAETKPFFLTSEFLAFVVAGAGVLIAAWVADNFEAPRAWLIPRS